MKSMNCRWRLKNFRYSVDEPDIVVMLFLAAVSVGALILGYWLGIK